MWGNIFSRANYELTIKRLGKKELNREITNLILTKIDMETTFCHHLLPSAIEYLTSLIEGVRGSEDMFINLDILKRYYREGERYNQEYLEYLEVLGASNEHDSFFTDFALKKGKDASYIDGVIRFYQRYAKTNMLNIIKLEDKIETLQREYDESEERYEEEMVKPVENKKGISKILDYFKRV